MSVLLNSQDPICRVVDHENEQCIRICTDKRCNGRERILCGHCMIEHQDHSDSLMKIKDFVENVNLKLKQVETFDNEKSQFNKQIDETVENLSQSLLKRVWKSVKQHLEKIKSEIKEKEFFNEQISIKNRITNNELETLKKSDLDDIINNLGIRKKEGTIQIAPADEPQQSEASFSQVNFKQIKELFQNQTDITLMRLEAQISNLYANFIDGLDQKQSDNCTENQPELIQKPTIQKDSEQSDQKIKSFVSSTKQEEKAQRERYQRDRDLQYYSEMKHLIELKENQRTEIEYELNKYLQEIEETRVQRDLIVTEYQLLLNSYQDSILKTENEINEIKLIQKNAITMLSQMQADNEDRYSDEEKQQNVKLYQSEIKELDQNIEFLFHNTEQKQLELLSQQDYYKMENLYLEEKLYQVDHIINDLSRVYKNLDIEILNYSNQINELVSQIQLQEEMLA